MCSALQKLGDTADMKRKKVVFLGDDAVGKTCLMRRCMDDTFSGSSPTTIGVDFLHKTVHLDKGVSLRLQLWDTAGAEKFRSLRKSHMLNTDAAVIVYDVTKLESFTSTQKWIEDVRSEVGADATIMLVGAKCDLDTRAVSTDEGKQHAAALSVMFEEVSAETGDNVTNMFHRVAASLLPTADFTVMMSATYDMTKDTAQLVLTNLGDEKLSTVDVAGANGKTWADIEPTLLPATVLRGRRPRFIFPDGYLACAADSSKTVKALLESHGCIQAAGQSCGLSKMFKFLSRIPI